MKKANYIAQNNSDSDKPLRIQAYARYMSDGAIGVLASMSIVITFDDKNGQEKAVAEPVIDGFSRLKLDAQPAYEVSFTPLAQKLVGMVYEQRNYERNPVKRERFIQSMAEKLGL